MCVCVLPFLFSVGRLLQQQGARPAATVTPAAVNVAGSQQVGAQGSYQQPPPNYGAGLYQKKNCLSTCF